MCIGITCLEYSDIETGRLTLFISEQPAVEGHTAECHKLAIVYFYRLSVNKKGFLRFRLTK